MPLVESLLVIAGKGFLDAVTPDLKKKFEAFLQKTDWYTASGRYYDKIEKTYGWTRILGKPEPVKLEGIFTDVYLLDKITAQQRFPEELEQDYETNIGEKKRLSGLDLVKNSNSKRLYLLGKPGAGKTTFLKYVALKASSNDIHKIPIFVSLKEWADSGDKLIDFLVKQFDICDFPESQPLIEYVLETGQAIVLFDGLDETQQEGNIRNKTINEIRNFSRKYDRSQILITCRIAATEFTFDEFTYFEVADLTEKQIESYVKKWFSNDPNKQNQFKEEFDKTENSRLREMANTPILLSLLCLNFEERGSFPARRVEIYEEGIDALLHKWDSTRNIPRDEIYKGLSIKRKRQMFAQIARQTFEKNEYFIKKAKLLGLITDYLSQLPDAQSEDIIDDEAVLKAIEAQHSIFVERANNVYSFSHLTFQEYFTAEYIVKNTANGTLEKLLTPVKIIDNRWQEVILNTASLLNNADDFFLIFQRSINYFIDDGSILTELFKRVEKKSESIETNIQQAAVRAFYSYLEFLVNYFITNENWSNDGEFAHLLNQEKYQDFTFDTAISLELNNSLICDIDPKFYQIIVKAQPPFIDFMTGDSGFIQDFKLSLILSKLFSINSSRSGDSIESDLILDYRLAFCYLFTVRLVTHWKEAESEHSRIINEFSRYWDETKNIYCNFVDIECSSAIKQLNPPSESSERNQWESFSEDLRMIMKNNRTTNDEWNMGNGKGSRLAAFFKANKFLITCLKLAEVSNRQAIENNLFLPPKTTD